MNNMYCGGVNKKELQYAAVSVADKPAELYRELTSTHGPLPGMRTVRD